MYEILRYKYKQQIAVVVENEGKKGKKIRNEGKESYTIMSGNVLLQT